MLFERLVEMPPQTESELTTSAPRSWIPEEPHLFVVLEGERPLAGGLRCALRDVDEVRIARGETRSVAREGRRLTLSIGDRKVSQEHARIVRAKGGWHLEDAGSTNGTFVNEERVTSRPLEDGDVILVGRTILRLRTEIPTPSGAEAVASSDARVMGLSTLLPALAAEHGVVARVSASAVSVLLLGETGSGKEVMARAIHDASKRRGAFVAVNCAALPDTLLESQLFGHVKGAFSGAARDELGFVRSADGGTLFLDEIGDLPRAAQAVLLRVLQEREVVPVGASRPVRVDLRVVAATHQPIEAMIARGDFRADLFARLQGFTHRLWPLRERLEDVGALVADLLPRLSPDAASVRIAPDAARALVAHAWPLNVRELAQCLARGLAVAQDGLLERHHFGDALGDRAQGDAAPEDAALRATLVAHLERTHGNVSAIARDMNKAPMQVYRWMRRFGLDPKRYRA